MPRRKSFIVARRSSSFDRSASRIGWLLILMSIFGALSLVVIAPIVNPL